MNLATKHSNKLLIFSTLLLLVISGILNNSYKKPHINVSKQDSALNFNDDVILMLNMGQKRLITDLFWIMTLLESDIEHYNKKDLNSWLYLRFKTIIRLDPLFLRAYRFGGKYLSIIKDDLYGAKEIFDKGLEVYPDDYDLLFDAAYLYAFELQDYKKAKELYQKVALFPKSPDFVKSLVNKIGFAGNSDLNLTFKVIYKLWQETPDETNLKTKLWQDLYSIKAELDLKCLNNNGKNCAEADFAGNPYILQDGRYISRFPFSPYRFKSRIKKN